MAVVTASEGMSRGRDGDAGYLLTGQYQADNVRSGTTLEPLTRALGVPWAARKVLNKIAPRQNITHSTDPARLCIETIVAGSTSTKTYILDGIEREMEPPDSNAQLREAVRATEDHEQSRVILEVRVLAPDRLRGVKYRDVYTLLPPPADGSIHRVITIWVPGEAPAVADRVLGRDPDSQPCVRRRAGEEDATSNEALKAAPEAGSAA